jgi:hypothetical protein
VPESAWYDAAGRPGPALRECLLAASAAPSVHNTQLTATPTPPGDSSDERPQL